MSRKLSLSVLKIRDFRLLMFTRMLVTLALQSQAVIVGWQVYSLTKDPFMLGLTGLAEALPAIAGAFFAGSAVDKGYPRKIYALCIAGLALNAFGLLLVAGEIVTVSRTVLLAYIFAGVFLSGLIRSFISPAAFSLLPKIVARADIPSATAWITTGWQIMAVTGPAVAGLVYGGYGARGAWLLPAFAMGMALLMILALKTPHTHNSEKREPMLDSIRAGWRFLMETPVLLSVMMLDMFAVLFGGAVAMLPAYADQVLHVGSEGLGALRAAPALGAVTTALFLALYPMQRITALRLLWVVAGFGFCMIGFGLSTLFWLSMVFLILSGVFDSVSVLIRGTLVQLLTPDAMRGRISAINSMFIISSNEIGAFESGMAARAMGLVPSVVAGGVVTLLIAAATAFLSPKFRKTVVNAPE